MQDSCLLHPLQPAACAPDHHTQNCSQPFLQAEELQDSGSFARRLLELGPKSEVVQQTRNVLQACDKSPKDEQKLHYDEHNPFDISVASFVPIYKGGEGETAPLSGAKYCP